MGGGASKRIALEAELQRRVTTVTDETASLVRLDRERRERTTAACRLQARHRGRSGRKLADARRAELAAAERAHEDAAATKIQALVRGEQSRAHQRERDCAARQIQRYWRGRTTRHELQRESAAATVLQAAQRGKV
eukprot:SAG11_NODE_11722_length_742_cov_0.897356_1_plen_135_part_01